MAQIVLLTHRGLEICTVSPATADDLGYTVNHPAFAGRSFNLVQDAVNSIDLHLKGGEQSAH